MKKHLVYFANHPTQGNGYHTKIGKTKHLRDRKSSLDTSYSEYGVNFEYLIYCETEEEESKIEKFLHIYFWVDSTTNYKNHTGGIEWFKRRYQLDEIKEALQSGGFYNTIIDDQNEIDELLKCYKDIYEREKEIYKKEMQKLNEEMIESKRNKKLTKRCIGEQFDTMINQVKMRDYQTEDKIMNWFDEYDKGILNWICGLGKTITSLNISQKYMKNYILIGLNNLGLFGQWIDSIVQFYDLPILCICSSSIDGYTTTTKRNIIKGWFRENQKGIVITSYRSAYKLKDLDILYDFEIFDECHHLCSVKNYDKDGEEIDEDSGKKIYGKNTDILSLNAKKRLGLTATMKKIDSNERINYNDNFNRDIFGEIIDEKSVLWGIEREYLCDYELACPLLKYEILEEMIENSVFKGINKEDYYLFLAAYMSIESILNGDRKKMLIFVNKINEIQKVYTYISRLSGRNNKFNMEDVFKVDKDTIDMSDILRRFNRLEYGIMINVYKIGEGIDIPSLDSVLIACDMFSKIRIVQSLLRCCRIHETKGKARFIIPMIYDDDSNFNSDDDIIKIKNFITVKEVIEQMSHSDMNIINRVKIGKISKSKGKSKDTYEINENIPELTNQFRMRIIKRFNIGKKLQFETMKRYIQELGGRKDDSKNYLQDYRDTKQCKRGLPDLDFLNKFLETKDYTIADLYSVDLSQYPTWQEFHKKYYNTYDDEYIRLTNQSDKLPKIHDLSDIYENYTEDFWNNSGNEF